MVEFLGPVTRVNGSIPVSWSSARNPFHTCRTHTLSFYHWHILSWHDIQLPSQYRPDVWSSHTSCRFHKKGTMFCKSCIDLHCMWNCLISTWFHSNRMLTDQVFREREKHDENSNGFERIRMEHPTFKRIRKSLLLPRRLKVDLIYILLSKII